MNEIRNKDGKKVAVVDAALKQVEILFKGSLTKIRFMDDGSVSVGSYDVVPIVDDFVEKHPDFSYRGSKGIVAVIGYNGVFGYRTDDAYIGKNPNIDQDKETVKKVAKCLRDDGWEIASHSWGHRYYGKISMYFRFQNQ